MKGREENNYNVRELILLSRMDSDHLINHGMTCYCNYDSGVVVSSPVNHLNTAFIIQRDQNAFMTGKFCDRGLNSLDECFRTDLKENITPTKISRSYECNEAHFNINIYTHVNILI